MVKAYELESRAVYPAGSFFSWRNQFETDVSSSWRVLDPRSHRQGAIAKLVEDDIRGVLEADAVFCVLPNGKSLPTMTYAELGAARIQKKPIILVDENEAPEKTIHFLATSIFSKYQQGIDYFLKGDFELTREPVLEREPTNPVKTIALAGNFKGLPKAFSNKSSFYASVFDFEKLAEADLLAVSFERGKRDKEAIALMGMAYTLGIPIALHEPNPIPYPPLAGLARRIFTGEQGKEIMSSYLLSVTSNDINQEAAVMYELFKKFNS